MHGTFAVARKGRKRKMRARQPDGRVRPERTMSPAAIAASQPHRHNIPNIHKLDQRAESVLGRLAIHGAITSAHYRAGKRYAQIVARYRAVIEAPTHNPPSLSGIMEARSSTGGIIPDSLAKEFKDAYDKAFESMEHNQKAQRRVARVAVYDEPCPDDCLDELRVGLDMLDQHFRRQA